MNGVGLPARILYALLAAPVGVAAGFYAVMWLLPTMTGEFPQLAADGDGFNIFKIAIGVGAALALSLSLLALTLPWKRHRKRSGRAGRMAAAGMIVVVASMGFSAERFSLAFDLLFATWLAYTMAFTFVRYGVLDQAKRSSGAGTPRIGE